MREKRKARRRRKRERQMSLTAKRTRREIRKRHDDRNRRKPGGELSYIQKILMEREKISHE